MATKRSSLVSDHFSQKKKKQSQVHAKAPSSILNGKQTIATLNAPKPQNVASFSDPRIDLNDQYDDLEETLRQFDMDMHYGPCLGLKRLERWERAHRMGMQPPIQVKEIIERVSGAPTCVWEGRV